jgi:DNA-directed RNA polymerase specialized sigma subunit
MEKFEDKRKFKFLFYQKDYVIPNVKQYIKDIQKVERIVLRHSDTY